MESVTRATLSDTDSESICPSDFGQSEADDDDEIDYGKGKKRSRTKTKSDMKIEDWIHEMGKLKVSTSRYYSLITVGTLFQLYSNSASYLQRLWSILSTRSTRYRFRLNCNRLW